MNVSKVCFSFKTLKGKGGKTGDPKKLSQVNDEQKTCNCTVEKGVRKGILNEGVIPPP